MLELNLTTILFEIINFLLLTALLYHFLFRPVMRNVQARADEKARLTREMEQARQAALDLQREWEIRLAGADEEAEKIVSRARKETEQARDETLQQTRHEVEHTLAEAHIEAHQAQQRAVADFHDQVVRSVLDTSGWLIRRTASPALHDALVQQLSDRVWHLGQNGMQQVETIRRSIQDRQPTVHITTARPLSANQQKNLLNTLSALADQELKLDLRNDAALVAGLRVRLGDMVLDNSIAGHLAELQGEVSAAIKHELHD